MRHYRLLIRLPWFLIVACLISAAGSARGAREPLDIVLLLDNSGSMHRENNVAGNDEHFMRIAAVQYLLEKMQAGDRAALVTFDTEAHTDSYASHLHDLTEPGQRSAFAQGVKHIAAVPSGSTNMAAGMRAAARILHDEARSGHRRFLILLTDGTPNPLRGDNTPAFLNTYADKLGREGIVIHTVGLGELSSDPHEAEAAQHFLENIARAGKGAPHRARNAADLPALFGSLFAQLVGHEISRLVPEGQEAAVTLTSGAKSLRVIATREGEAPEIVLTDPQGKIYHTNGVPPLMKDQTATIGVVTASAREGTWRARATKGSLEVAYQPDFEAVLLAPANNSPVPAAAAFAVVAEVRRAESSPALPVPASRVVVEYERVRGDVPVAVTLLPDTAKPGRFHGTVMDSGGVGAHPIRARCFRMDNGVEVEGGPAYGTIQAALIPVLSVETPAASDAFSIPGPVGLEARLNLLGKPLKAPPSGLTVSAHLKAAADDQEHVLAPNATGGYTHAFTLRPTAAPVDAKLDVTLSGNFQGTTLTPQTVSIPLSITPRPTVTVHWKTADRVTVNPDGDITFTAQVASSAAGPQTIAFDLQECPHTVLENAALTVSAHQSARNVPVRLRFHALPPGNYRPRLTAHMDSKGAELLADALQPSVHVRTWLERNRWWVVPLVLLLIFSVLAAVIGGALWKREQSRRRRLKLAQINRVYIYIAGTAQPFNPPYLDRYEFLVGGPQGASDVFIWNPDNPDEPMFAMPVLKVEAIWRHGKAMITASPIGMLTTLFDAEQNRVPKDLMLKNEITNFSIDVGGKRTEVQVRRGIVRSPRTHHEGNSRRSTGEDTPPAPSDNTPS